MFPNSSCLKEGFDLVLYWTLIPPTINSQSKTPPRQFMCTGWWGVPRNWPPPLWAHPFHQLSPEESPDLQLLWAAAALHSHRAAARVLKGWKALGELRKSCRGETEKKNWGSRENNLYFCTSASCSYTGQKITAGSFLGVFDSQQVEVISGKWGRS